MRCESAANAINAHNEQAVAWCYLNDESKALKDAIPGAVEVSGSDSMEFKEDAFSDFVHGKIRVLVTKPDIAGFGLNWQHCAHQTFFPSHSFEQWHQAIRRSWRFGQTKPVTIDIITSEGERGVMANLMRKSEQADILFSNLVALIGEANTFNKRPEKTTTTKIPTWLQLNNQ